MENKLKLNVRRVKRICDMRGCKETDCFSFARGNEFVNPIILCKNCVKDMYNIVFPSSEVEAPASDTVVPSETEGKTTVKKTVQRSKK